VAEYAADLIEQDAERHTQYVPRAQAYAYAVDLRAALAAADQEEER
jgi:hypothetical protein